MDHGVVIIAVGLVFLVLWLVLKGAYKATGNDALDPDGSIGCVLYYVVLFGVPVVLVLVLYSC